MFPDLASNVMHLQSSQCLARAQTPGRTSSEARQNSTSCHVGLMSWMCKHSPFHPPCSEMPQRTRIGIEYFLESFVNLYAFIYLRRAKIYTGLQKKFSSNAAAVDAWKPDLKPKLPSVVPSYDRTIVQMGWKMCRSSGFRRTVVQLYDSSKTQNAHNFGHRHATDPYFTFLRMAKKVFLVKFFWHRRDSNPRPVLVIILQYFLDLDAKWPRLYFEEELHYFAAKNG